MPDTTSVVAIGEKKCKPFIVEVMIFSPESGYKIEVCVERSCTADNDSIWKVVFDLYKEKDEGDGFVQLVHVSYRGKDPDENRSIQKTLNGVTPPQADVLINEVHPAAKEFAETGSEESKAKVGEASKHFVRSAEF